MVNKDKDVGTIEVVLERLDKFRLPRALELKKKVDAGGTLDDADVQFLKRVMVDTTNAQEMAKRHPELQSLVAKLSGLYNEITGKALENEKNVRK